MKNFKSLLVAAALIVPAISFSAVWQSDKNWTVEWEQKYSEWMTSAAVYKEMFRDKNNPYYGISADCADAAYALRAIFAYENKLPFAVTLPSGSRKNKSFSNNTTRFDKKGPENRRLVAMMNYLADMVGSESLTLNDSYPVAIKSIAPATLFTHKIKARFGKRIRHVYTIKDVRPNGNFDLIYSTQAIRKKRLPMQHRMQKPLVNKPHGNWGFRRLKWPSLLFASSSQYPVELGYSREQYDLASKKSASQFFRYVKEQLKVVDETAEHIVKRALKTVCTEAQARIQYVNQGVEANINGRGKCMNYEDYDAYSTPARDKALKETYSALFEELRAISEAGDSNSVSPELSDIAVAIFNYKSASTEAKAGLMEYCPINYKVGTTIDLGELYNRQQRGLLSSHPNDRLERRWGEKVGKKTRCKAHY